MRDFIHATVEVWFWFWSLVWDLCVELLQPFVDLRSGDDYVW